MAHFMQQSLSLLEPSQGHGGNHENEQWITEANRSVALSELQNLRLHTALECEVILAEFESEKMKVADDESAEARLQFTICELSHYDMSEDDRLRISRTIRELNHMHDERRTRERDKNQGELRHNQLLFEGQLAIQWWAPWMKEATAMPTSFQEFNRPAWFVVVVMSYEGQQSLPYAGMQNPMQHCYKTFNVAGVPGCYEAVPASFLAEHIGHYDHEEHGWLGVRLSPEFKVPPRKFWIRALKFFKERPPIEHSPTCPCHPRSSSSSSPW